MSGLLNEWLAGLEIKGNLNFSLLEEGVPIALAGRMEQSMAFSMKTHLEPVSSKLAY
jgi:hypothetical protein